MVCCFCRFRSGASTATLQQDVWEYLVLTRDGAALMEADPRVRICITPVMVCKPSPKARWPIWPNQPTAPSSSSFPSFSFLAPPPALQLYSRRRLPSPPRAAFLPGSGGSRRQTRCRLPLPSLLLSSSSTRPRAALLPRLRWLPPPDSLPPATAALTTPPPPAEALRHAPASSAAHRMSSATRGWRLPPPGLPAHNPSPSPVRRRPTTFLYSRR